MLDLYFNQDLPGAHIVEAFIVTVIIFFMANFVFLYAGIYLFLAQDTINIPTFITPEIINGISIGIATFVTILLIRYTRKSRPFYVFVNWEPSNNMTCPELRYSWFFSNFQVIVVELGTNTVLGTYFLTEQLSLVLVDIEIIHQQLLMIDNMLEIEYFRVENLSLFDNNAPAISVHDQSINLLCNDKREKLCHLRKLESMYLIFVSTYKRKPEFTNESL